MVWILRKKGDDAGIVLPPNMLNRRLVPFVWNRVQRDLDNRLALRNVLLKFRQGGYTTFFLLVRLFLAAVLDPGTNGMLISRNNEYAAKHFAMLKRAYRFFGAIDPMDMSKNAVNQSLLANLMHFSYSSRKELILDQIDSTVFCTSAQVSEAGQGTTLAHVVCDDIAHWTGDVEELMANMKEAIVDGGTLDIESTANGLGGYFSDECYRARDASPTAEFKFFFHEWWWDDAYRSPTLIEEKDLTADEARLRRQFHLDLQQIAWRRSKQVGLRARFLERYPEDVPGAFLTTGNAFFDMPVLRKRYEETATEVPLSVLAGGDLLVYKRRVPRRRYVIGADTASGRQINDQDTDFAVACVIDLETGEDIATFRRRTPPESFAEDLAELGEMYNNALIAVELTGDGHTTLLTLRRELQYSSIYRHSSLNKKTREAVQTDGWPTTPKTRPVMLNKLAQFVRDESESIRDRRFLEEAMKFLRGANGIPRAASGFYDDTVMAKAIAHIVRLVTL
ncbi:MAG: hypothetical protein KGL39_29080, partial [Patescibacteria group bacterium]|nr:hypothetical protein [Patescibacteria group bacterium]